MDGDVALALVPTMMATIIIWRAARSVRDAELQKFVDRFFVRIEEGEDQFVRARLRRSRAIRLSAVALGVLIAGLPSYMNLINPSRSSDFNTPLVGNAWIGAAAGAALLAEIVVIQWPLFTRQAVIEVRRPRDYVAPRWTRQLWVTGLITVVVATIGTVAGRGDDLELIAGGGGAVLAVGAAWVGLRQIADRPRLAPAGRPREIDDALRSYGAHHLVGAATALVTTSLSIALTAVIVDNWLLSLVGFGVSYYGLVAWWAIAREQPWPVRHEASVS